MTHHTAASPAADVCTDDPVVVRCAGDLDLSSAPAFSESVAAALARSSHVVLDMRHVPFCDSAGLRVIATAIRQTRERGGSLTLRDPQPLPLTALRISGLAFAVRLESAGADA